MSKLRDLQIDEISLVDEGDNPGAHVTFFKRKGGPLMGLFRRDVTKQEDGMPEAPASESAPVELTLDSVLAKIASILSEEEAALLKEKLGMVAEEAAAEGEAMLDAAEALAKSMPEDARREFEKQRSEIAKLRAEVEKQRDGEARAKRIAKQREHGALLHGTAEARGDLVHRIAKAAGDAVAGEVEQILSASAEQVARGNLFGELGSASPVYGDEYSAAVAEVKKAKPEISDVAARVEAVRRNPKLYKDMI